jgi:hypothetical protein
MFRKMALFPSSGECRKTPTLLGPLERANHNHSIEILTCDFHGDDYEECRLRECDVVWLLQVQMFLRNLSPPSSGY